MGLDSYLQEQKITLNEINILILGKKIQTINWYKNQALKSFAIHVQ